MFPPCQLNRFKEIYFMITENANEKLLFSRKK